MYNVAPVAPDYQGGFPIYSSQGVGPVDQLCEMIMSVKTGGVCYLVCGFFGRVNHYIPFILFFLLSLFIFLTLTYFLAFLGFLDRFGVFYVKCLVG